MDCSPPGSSVHGILKARILEWLPFPSPGDLPNPRIEPWSPHCRQILYWQSHKGSPNLLSVQFSCSVVSNSLWPRGLQHFRLPSSSPTPGACLNSCPSSRWCHPTISSSVVPFSFCLQSFPASGSFPMSQFFTSGGQSIWASASASVLPKNIQDFRISFSIDWFDLLAVQGQAPSPASQFESISSSVPFPFQVDSKAVWGRWNSDAIQPFYPLLSLSPSAFNLSQHQDLFQWVFVSSSH